MKNDIRLYLTQITASEETDHGQKYQLILDTITGMSLVVLKKLVKFK